MRLFVELKPVSRAEVEEAIDHATLDAFLNLDLVRVCDGDASRYFSPVFLYPVGDLLIASDRYNESSGPDAVFPAIETGTLRLLKVVPRSAAEDGLDICSGTGIGAFVLSRHVQRIVASDITPRAAHFARFNRLLNGCSNVEIETGDLYGPVEGRTFDRIIAHPPYVPTTEGSEVWRDGGSTGEAITKRIIEALPQYLRPGGELFALCLGAEQDKHPFEQRVRTWLGDSHHEFDLIFAVHKYLTPKEMAERATQREATDSSAEATAAMERTFHNAGINRFCFGVLAMRRLEAPALKPWTLRTKLGAEAVGASFESAFDRSRRCTKPGTLPELRPRLSPTLRTTVTHRVERSKLVVSEFAMETDRPFVHGTKADTWVLSLLSRFNGSFTVSKIYAKARAEGILPVDFQSADFEALVLNMIRHGYLEIDDPTSGK